MHTLVFEILGTLAFAISGAFVGMEKKMDILGIVTMAVITSVGGGIIRDILIGVAPPTTFRHPEYAMLAIIVALLVFLPRIGRQINLDQPIWIVADTVGLGAFTMTGASIGATFDNVFLGVFLGVITGVGGGVIRDVCCGAIPMIFVKDFYASPCIIGAIVYLLLCNRYGDLALDVGFVTVVALRLMATKYKWNLPSAA